jgi:hypothetical protein
MIGCSYLFRYSSLVEFVSHHAVGSLRLLGGRRYGVVEEFVVFDAP